MENAPPHDSPFYYRIYGVIKFLRIHPQGHKKKRAGGMVPSCYYVTLLPTRLNILFQRLSTRKTAVIYSVRGQ